MENENCRSCKRGTHDLEIPTSENQNVSLLFQDKAHKTDPMNPRATAGGGPRSRMKEHPRNFEPEALKPKP